MVALLLTHQLCTTSGDVRSGESVLPWETSSIPNRIEKGLSTYFPTFSPPIVPVPSLSATLHAFTTYRDVALGKVASIIHATSTHSSSSTPLIYLDLYPSTLAIST